MVLNTTGSSRVDKVARWFDWSQLTLTASQARSGWKARHHGGTQFSPDVASSSGYARCRTNLRAQRTGLRSKKTMLRQADRKSTRLNSSHTVISYAVFCLKKKTQKLTMKQRFK